MTLRISQIDGSNIADHARLRADDTCLYIFEYTSRRNYTFSQTNNLINNLKKKPSSSAAQLGYKRQAISNCAGYFRDTLNAGWLATATLVPVPGSKAPGHPDYDDRMAQVCAQIASGLDVRAMVRQTASTTASHEAGESGDRVTVEELLAVYELDETIALPLPATIAIVDDVLTAGTHYRAMHTVLSARFPGVPIYGLFIARRVFPPEDF
ncbi:hypothetical protein [Brevundimonas naejangsanensis]